jgi:hypothetical protein
MRQKRSNLLPTSSGKGISFSTLKIEEEVPYEVPYLCTNGHCVISQKTSELVIQNLNKISSTFLG